MLTAPRQIVLDKDAFLGIRLEDLHTFAATHFLLLSDALLYECATARRQAPQILLDRYESLIRAGAYYCSMSRRFVEWECRQCRPHPLLLADLDETNNVRRGKRWIGGLIGSDAAARAYDQRRRLADIMLLRQSQEAVDKVGRDLAGEFKAFPKDAPTRFRKILDEMLFDVQHWAATYYSQWITDPTKFCLSPEWMTWHEIRLLKAVFVEYTYLRQTSCAPSREHAEHDYQDMEYVLLLSRADAIITRDKKMVEPLARATFPEKDVFSSLDEVPESYRCDWANR